MYEESSSNEGIDNEATVERMDVLKLNDWNSTTRGRTIA